MGSARTASPETQGAEISIVSFSADPISFLVFKEFLSAKAEVRWGIRAAAMGAISTGGKLNSGMAKPL